MIKLMLRFIHISQFKLCAEHSRSCTGVSFRETCLTPAQQRSSKSFMGRFGNSILIIATLAWIRVLPCPNKSRPGYSP